MPNDRESEGERSEYQPLFHDSTTSASVITGTAVKGGDDRSRGLLFGGIGLGLVAILFLLLSGSDDADSPTDDQLLAETNVDSEAGSENAEVAEATTTTAPVLSGVLFPESIGYWLFLGGEDPLQRFDLDTGQRVEYGVRAEPIMTVGDQLVLYRETSDNVGWVSIEDPGQQALTWKTGAVARAEEPGTLWVLERGGLDELNRWTLFDVDENRILEQREGTVVEDGAQVPSDTVEARVLGGRNRAIVPGPELYRGSDGFVRSDSENETTFGPGSVLTYDANLALIRNCPDPSTIDLGCRVQWFERGTGAESSLALPWGSTVFAEFLLDGWLRSVDVDGRSMLLPLDGQEPMEFEAGRTINVSPDGRWLAEYRPGWLTLHDLSTGMRVIEVEFPDRLGAGGLVFVPKS